MINATGEDLNLQSFKQRSMGGASIAISHDESAIYQNPAGLYLSKFRVKLPRIGLHANRQITDESDKIRDLLHNDKGNGSKQLAILKDLVPKTIGLKYSALPIVSWTWRGIGVGVMTEGAIKGTLLNKADPQLRIEGHNDIVPAIGIAQEFYIFGPTMIGASAKYIKRHVIYNKETGEDFWRIGSSKLIELINSDNDDDDDLPSTYTVDGIGFDIGLLRKMDSTWLGNGHWGVSIRNIGAVLSGEKEITGNRTVDASQELPLSAGIGFGTDVSLFSEVPVINWVLSDLNIAADYYVVSPHSKFLRNLKMGVEKKLFWDMLKLRGGLNDGYIVGGAGLDLRIWKIPILHISYSYYVEEFGENLGDNPQEFQAIELGILF